MVTLTHYAAAPADALPLIAPGQLAPEAVEFDGGFSVLPHVQSWRGKRVLDLVTALFLVTVVAPVAFLVALAIWLEAPGLPILFRQHRVGRGNRDFAMLKFRTMQPDAEERLRAEPHLLSCFIAADHKIPDHLDPRITRIGRFLRRSSLDEIPQLFNVLAGHMSLVGPRPVERTQLSQYEHRRVYYLAVRPGLTGLWQVSGRSKVSFPERAELDESYACTCTFQTDLKVLARTPRAVLQGLNEDK